MRVDEVMLAGAAAPLILHPRLTVISGLGPMRRTELLSQLRGAMAGSVGTVVRWTDEIGEPRVVQDEPLLIEVIGALPQSADAAWLVNLLTRARVRPRCLAVADDPFAHLPIMRVWELLAVLERVTERVQTLLLTADEVTVAWASQRATAGDIALVRG